MKDDFVKSLPPYAFIAYEPEDALDSTGAVLYYADSVHELADRMHISPVTIYNILGAQKKGKTYDRRIPYEIRQVYLS